MWLRSSYYTRPDEKRVEKYLNNKAVRAALHASQCPLVFKECTDPPYNALKHQDGLGVTREIAFLLERNVRMIFFNGGFFFLAASLQHMKKKKRIGPDRNSTRSPHTQPSPHALLD